jgi:hypothetical protein
MKYKINLSILAIFVFYFHTKFLPLNYTKLLAIMIRPKAEEAFHVTTRRKLTFKKKRIVFIFGMFISQFILTPHLPYIIIFIIVSVVYIAST